MSKPKLTTHTEIVYTRYHGDKDIAVVEEVGEGVFKCVSCCTYAQTTQQLMLEDESFIGATQEELVANGFTVCMQDDENVNHTFYRDAQGRRVERALNFWIVEETEEPEEYPLDHFDIAY